MDKYLSPIDGTTITEEIVAKQLRGARSAYGRVDQIRTSSGRSTAKYYHCKNTQFGTIVWPGDIDISPETLYIKSIPV